MTSDPVHNLVKAVNKLKELLGPDGNYTIVRDDRGDLNWNSKKVMAAIKNGLPRD